MDSDKLKYFVRLSTLQVKMSGSVSASLSLEMIEHMRQQENILNKFPVKCNNGHLLPEEFWGEDCPICKNLAQPEDSADCLKCNNTGFLPDGATGMKDCKCIQDR